MTIGYDVVSNPDADKTIIVLPGSPGSRRLRFMPGVFEGVSARIVVTERPGFGITPPQPGRTIQDHVAQLIEVADELGCDRFAIAAYSGGGSYALGCGAAHPDRVRVIGLICAAVSAHDRPEVDSFLRPEIQLVTAGMRSDPEGTKAAIARFVQPQFDAYQADPQAFFDQFVAGTGRALEDLSPSWKHVLEDAYTKDPSVLAEEFAVVSGPLGFAFEDVQVPVRVFHGTADDGQPMELLRDLVKRLPDATLTEWEGDGHFVSAEHNHEALCEVASYL